MDPNTRPNIVTIGALAGALSWFVCFGLAKAGLELGAEGGVAMSTLVTFVLQYADRVSKRGVGHVLAKYGPSQDAEAVGGRDDVA